MNNISVNIFGEKYSLSGDNDSTKIREYAKYLDSKLNQLEKTTTTESNYKLAILCGLNIIEELFLQKKNYSYRKTNWSSLATTGFSC